MSARPARAGRSAGVRARNRRFAFARRMLAGRADARLHEENYFSDVAMQRRVPALFRLYIGQHMNARETRELQQAQSAFYGLPLADLLLRRAADDARCCTGGTPAVGVGPADACIHAPGDRPHEARCASRDDGAGGDRDAGTATGDVVGEHGVHAAGAGAGDPTDAIDDGTMALTYAQTLRTLLDHPQQPLSEPPAMGPASEDLTLRQQPHFGAIVEACTAASLSAAEKQHLRMTLVNVMCERFIDGLDRDFDYAAVDEDETYDDLTQIARDAEDSYFDAEQPGTAPPSPAIDAEWVGPPARDGGC